MSLLDDVRVTVDAQITGPAGVALTPRTNLTMVNTTRYTGTSMVSSFGRNQSGEYTCTATVKLSTTSQFVTGGSGATGIHNITIGTGNISCIKCFYSPVA